MNSTLLQSIKSGEVAKGTALTVTLGGEWEGKTYSGTVDKRKSGGFYLNTGSMSIAVNYKDIRGVEAQ